MPLIYIDVGSESVPKQKYEEEVPREAHVLWTENQGWWLLKKKSMRVFLSIEWCTTHTKMNFTACKLKITLKKGNHFP